MGVFDDDHDTCEACERCGQTVEQAGSTHCDACIDIIDKMERKKGPVRDFEGRTAQDRYDDEWGDPLDTDLRY